MEDINKLSQAFQNDCSFLTIFDPTEKLKKIKKKSCSPRFSGFTESGDPLSRFL